MGIEVDFTKEDAIFLDMTNSPISPNHKPVFLRECHFSVTFG